VAIISAAEQGIADSTTKNRKKRYFIMASFRIGCHDYMVDRDENQLPVM
jgi:hypothetical protein